MANLIGKDCCKNCKFSYYDPQHKEFACRFNPPSCTPIMGMGDKGPFLQGKLSLFPRVEPDWVCGQFKKGLVKADEPVTEEVPPAQRFKH